jgi:hypothetical protein
VKILAAAAALMFVVAAAAATGATRSGLRGEAVIDPAFPVCRASEPCTRPAGQVWLVFSRRGRHRRTLTSEDGSYRVRLRPGTYAVTSPKVVSLEPHRVTVRRGRFLRVDFEIDIGIR